MASSKWKTVSELKDKIRSRDYVFWGASNWIEKTVELITLHPRYIIDKSPLNQGIIYNEFEVKSPDSIDLRARPYVVITTVNYLSVIYELESFGYVMGDDFCVSPALNERKAKDDLLSHEQSILVASPQHFADQNTGGGLYKVTLNPFSVEKLYIGKARGVTFFEGKYYLIDMLRGVVVLDSNFKEIDLINLQKNCEPHGLCIDPQRRWILIGQPGRDSVAVYEIDTKNLINEIFISEKWKKNKKDNHHINDPFVFGDSLYVAVFSFSGNWLNEIYDGGIMEFDLHGGVPVGAAMSEMWMPHSIIRVNGKITVLNSMLGELWSGSYDKVAELAGFARGLDYDGEYYYIGITEHRYPEKLHGRSNNISLDTGFFVFDPRTKMSKFYSLDFIGSIHDILVIRDNG